MTAPKAPFSAAAPALYLAFSKHPKQAIRDAIAEVQQAYNRAALDLAEWAAAGFDDTLLRWKMKLEVANGHEKEIQPRVQA